MREQFSSNFEGVFLTGSVLQDVKASQVRAILDYMYRGEVSVAQDELPSLLRVAEMLKVKGMTEENTKADTKLPAPRCSSPGSGAPPNSIVPPNGESPAPAPVTSSMPVPTPSKTPTSIPPPHGAIPPNFRPFPTPPAGATTPPFPMWPLPGLFPGAHNLFGRHEERKELSPGPAAARDRSKMSSGSSSDKEIPLPPLIPRDSCGDSADRDSAQNSSFDKSEADYNEKVKLGDIAGYVPAQRLEWKRYKQYTRNDIMQAIEEVRKGEATTRLQSCI